MWYVYVLFSVKFNRFYTGSSADPSKRLSSHNDSRNKGWTARYASWKIIYTEKCNSRSDALKKEKWLKSGVGRDFITSIFSDNP